MAGEARTGESRLGVAWQSRYGGASPVAATLGETRRGTAGMARHGESSPGGLGLGEAWLGRHGAARSGMSGPGVSAHGAGKAGTVRRVEACLGVSRSGLVWQAGQGVLWRSVATSGAVCRGEVWQARHGLAWFDPARSGGARQCPARQARPASSKCSSPSSIARKADRTTGYRQEETVMDDLTTADDVAQWYATNPPAHEHERVLDELADVFGYERGLKIYARGLAMATGDDQ